MNRRDQQASGQQPINVQFGCRADVHLAIRHGWYRELHGGARQVARTCLIAVVEFSGDVCRVKGVQDCRAPAIVCEAQTMPFVSPLDETTGTAPG